MLIDSFIGFINYDRAGGGANLQRKHQPREQWSVGHKQIPAKK